MSVGFFETHREYFEPTLVRHALYSSPWKTDRTVPDSTAQLSEAVDTVNTGLCGQLGDEAVQTSCFMNSANRDDVYVAQPWLKGIPAAHVAAYPYTLTLAALYPG
jgi:peptide/nickel transport system substrate-binding protein